MHINTSWKKVPFTEKEYYVTQDGKVISNAMGWLNKLKGKKLTKNSDRLIFEAIIISTGYRHSILYNRIVFFCFEYPKILGKKLEKMTWIDYQKMPLIAHKDGNQKNTKISNLILIPSRTKLGEWVVKNFPEKCKYKETKKSVIRGEDLTNAITWLKNGKTFAWIANHLSVSVHEQTIWRLHKHLGLPSRKKGKILTKKERSKIKELSNKNNGVELAKNFGVTPSTICRILKKTM